MWLGRKIEGFSMKRSSFMNSNKIIPLCFQATALCLSPVNFIYNMKAGLNKNMSFLLYSSLFLAFIFLSGCDSPLSTSSNTEISDSLGEKLSPLNDGFYEISLFKNQKSEELSGDQISRFLYENEIPKIHSLVWHSKTKTYISHYGKVRFFNFDNTNYIVSFPILGEKRLSYFLAQVHNGGDSVIIYLYGCKQIPENLRVSVNIEKNCKTEDRNSLIRAIGSLKLDELSTLRLIRRRDFPEPY